MNHSSYQTCWRPTLSVFAQNRFSQSHLDSKKKSKRKNLHRKKEKCIKPMLGSWSKSSLVAFSLIAPSTPPIAQRFVTLPPQLPSHRHYHAIHNTPRRIANGRTSEAKSWHLGRSDGFLKEPSSSDEQQPYQAWHENMKYWLVWWGSLSMACLASLFLLGSSILPQQNSEWGGLLRHCSTEKHRKT